MGCLFTALRGVGLFRGTFSRSALAPIASSTSLVYLAVPPCSDHWRVVGPPKPSSSSTTCTSPTPSTSSLPMSTANRTPDPLRSNDNFTAIFQAAASEYEKVTGKSLDSHPFATQLETCDSPEAVSSVLLTQAQASSKSRKTDERLMAFLDPTIHILFTFSATLGEGIGLVSRLICPIFSSSDIWLSHFDPRKPFPPGSPSFWW